MTIKELREKAANLITQARAKRDEITSNTDEARAADLERQFDAMVSEAEDLNKRANTLERLARLEAGLEAGDDRRPSGQEGRADAGSQSQPVSYREAFHAWLQAGGDVYAMAPEARAALAQGQVNLSAEQRAQVTGNPAAGGNLVPDEAHRAIVKAMAAWGPMFDDGFATVINTTGGGSMPIPGVDDTDNEASQNTTEGAALGNGTDAVFTKKTLEDFMYDTGWLTISIQLATSGMEAMDDLLGGLLGERLGRKANRVLTVGTGSGEPHGIVGGASASGVPIAGVDALTSDEILAFYHSVDPAYRAAPKFGAMFNDNTLLAIHRLKDNQGRYLVDEAPDGAGRIRVGGVSFRYRINQAMPDMGANARSMVMGDMGKYYVRKIGNVVIGTANDSKFWPGFGIAGYTRMDGAVADAKAIKTLIHPAA